MKPPANEPAATSPIFFSWSNHFRLIVLEFVHTTPPPMQIGGLLKAKSTGRKFCFSFIIWYQAAPLKATPPRQAPPTKRSNPSPSRYFHEIIARQSRPETTGRPNRRKKNLVLGLLPTGATT